MKTRFKFIWFVLLAFSVAHADGQGFIRRPPPADPVVLPKSLYTEIMKSLPDRPEMGSPAQKRDEEILRSRQSSRTEADCKRALSEVDNSVESFFVKNDGPLTSAEAALVKPLLQLIGGDTHYFTEKLKVDFPRRRPFEYMTDIHPCVPKETTAAYPSGHAVLSKLEALVLGDLLPKKRDRFLARSQVIANDRVLGGVHHSSDIEAGRKIADFFYTEFKKTEKYRAEFDRLSKALRRVE